MTSVTNNVATGASTGDLKTYFGQINIYGIAYGNTPIGPYGTDSLGDPRPFQTSSAIANNPFTPANSSLIAYQIQQTSGNQQTSGDPQNWQIYQQSPSFPSGHSTIGNVNAIAFAILAPGYYQQLLQSGVDFGYSRNVFGAHYPLDVIGGRILATYVTAETLAGEIRCTRPRATTRASHRPISPRSARRCRPISAAAALRHTRRHAPTSLACLSNGTIPTAAAYTQAHRTTPII